MVSEVKGPGAGVVSALEQTKAPAETNRAAAVPAAPAARQDTVELTSTAAQLQRLTQAVADVPEVDESRVSMYRQQIAEGSFNVSPEGIADKMTRLESMLDRRA